MSAGPYVNEPEVPTEQDWAEHEEDVYDAENGYWEAYADMYHAQWD